ncbi:MAG: aldo/keto reductase [Bacteroidales bacterium]|nr:aldo/keto reductase [Bacteroidales bacterium]
MRFNNLMVSMVAVVTLLFSACQCTETPEKPVNMKYRELGKTGLMVSEIGLGCECFADQDTAFSRQYMNLALDSGINYIDIYTSDPIVRSNIGYALQGRRDKMFIQGHIGTVWVDGQYKRTRDIEEAKAGFNDLLTRLNTDYIDVGMIHIADSREDWLEVVNGPFIQLMKDLKAEGKIHHIGLSSHNTAVALEAVQSGLIEVLMFSINPIFDMMPAGVNLWDSTSYAGNFTNIDSTRMQLYEACVRQNVGISVMKVFGGGRLLDAQQSVLGVALTPCQCIHYALGRPAVATALSGARTIDELLASLHYETATDAEKDYATAFAKSPKASWKGECIYCGHCSPCPQGIDIDKITKLLNLAKMQDSIPQSLIDEYKALKHKAGECTQCGSCESRCPFSVSIRENMIEAKKIFGE